MFAYSIITTLLQEFLSVTLSLSQWIKKNSALLFNTGSLVGTMLVTSVFGFAYWWVAARFFIPEAVGLASATTSAMMLLSTFCLLGLGTLLISEIPRNEGKEGTLISTALLLVGGISLVIGALFAILSPLISQELQPIGASVPNIAHFAVSISITAITVIVDHAVIGLLKGGLQFWRNVLFSVSKLLALYLLGLWFSDKIGMNIYATWTLGNLLSLLPLLGLALWKNRDQPRNFLPSLALSRKLSAAAFQHHFLNLIIQAPTQLLPILVTVLLSATMNAWFYVAAMIANFIFSLSLSLTTVLHATNAAQKSTLAQKARLTVILSVTTSVIASGFLVVNAEAVLSFFGPSYAEQAVWPLRILALGSFPLIIKNHYIAIRRIKDEITDTLIPITLGSLLELILATIGAHMAGLIGLSLGWQLALCFESFFMFRLVFTTLCSKDPATDVMRAIADRDTLILAAIHSGITSIPGQTTNVAASRHIPCVNTPAFRRIRLKHLRYTKK
jgi:O-antigen/teichoic acid export membrane protein